MIINEFISPYRFLSNFYPTPMTYLGWQCPTSEHAFQLAKTNSNVMQRMIAHASSPSSAKRIGRRVELRPDWEKVKLRIMKEVVILKFTSNADITRQLMMTYPHELQEGNNWNDTYWGVDLGSRQGENHLGRILMEVREMIRVIRV